MTLHDVGDRRRFTIVQLAGSPPAGWQVRLPGHPVQALVDGTPTLLRPDGQLALPAGTHALVVRYVTSPP